MGEHAAVYGRPALVAAVDRRVTATFEEATAGPGVRLEVPPLGFEHTAPWQELIHQASRARDAWETYARAPDPEAFERLRGTDRSHLVKVAFGEAATALRTAGATLPESLHVTLDSTIPIGAGFGSSAAVAAAVVRGLWAWVDAPWDPEEAFRLTLDIERRQHGLPSGVDNATVLHGGVVWVQRNAEGALDIEPLETHPLLDRIQVFNTGEPRESTGEVVAEVRRRRNADPTGFETLLDRMERATRDLRDLLTSTDPSTTDHDLVNLFAEFHHCLCACGVVPPSVQRAVEAIEARGGAAKISGAGSLSEGGSGSLLVYHPDPGVLDELLDHPFDYERLDLRLGARGVRVDEERHDP